MWKGSFGCATKSLSLKQMAPENEMDERMKEDSMKNANMYQRCSK